jgi:hypothetical protein
VAEVGDVSLTRDYHRVAIDFEVASGRRACACACAVGKVCVRQGRIEGVESHLIQPPGNADSGFNISIHGIDQSMTRDSPALAELSGRVHWPTACM